jgi:hypothetical protein
MQTLTLPAPVAPRLYRWTRAEYNRLGEAGFLLDRRVELIDGEIIEMSPKGPQHSTATERARRVLAEVFPRTSFTVRAQEPLALGEWDEPEPDLAVVAGDLTAYQHAHPTAEQTLLVVEVAEATAAYDLGRKGDLYAAAGIKDYWVVLPSSGQIVVMRRPLPNAASRTRTRYADQRRLEPGESLAPLAAPDHPVAVTDLLGVESV